MTMKCTLFLLVGLTGMATRLPALDADSPWHTDSAGYQTVLAEQKKTGDLILLYFYATWCQHCRAFEKTVLYTPGVESAVSGVPKVKIDVDREQALAAKFGVTSFPRVYVWEPKSNKIYRMNTGAGPDDFLKQARKFGLKIR